MYSILSPSPDQVKLQPEYTEYTSLQFPVNTIGYIHERNNIKQQNTHTNPKQTKAKITPTPRHTTKFLQYTLFQSTFVFQFFYAEDWVFYPPVANSLFKNVDLRDFSQIVLSKIVEFEGILNISKALKSAEISLHKCQNKQN